MNLLQLLLAKWISHQVATLGGYIVALWDLGSGSIFKKVALLTPTFCDPATVCNLRNYYPAEAQGQIQENREKSLWE